MIITGENVPPGTTRFEIGQVQRSEQTRNILWVDVVALNDEDDQLARWTVPGNGHGIHRDSLGPVLRGRR